MDEFDFGIADPRTDDVRRLIERHLRFGRSHSPPEDAHALDVDGLLDPDVTLFSFRCRGELLAIGALKRLDDQHAELKTMHTVAHARGRGIGRAMLDYLLAAARDRGLERVSLETGSMEAFGPARSLYTGAGFTPCEPFGDYRESPNSTYMTRRLGATADPVSRPASAGADTARRRVVAAARFADDFSPGFVAGAFQLALGTVADFDRFHEAVATGAGLGRAEPGHDAHVRFHPCDV